MTTISLLADVEFIVMIWPIFFDAEIENMKLAQTILQILYGGKDTRPEWQIKATNALQELNWGYHPGRFINCIEITMHAFKCITLSKGELKFNVTPLPNLPPFLAEYHSQKLDKRFRELEDDKKPVKWQKLSKEGSYSSLINWLKTSHIPAYSHFILFTNLKKLPGGHVISGIVLPEDEKGLSVFLYDAQGFIPDAWLSAEQFDEFYEVMYFYVYQSELTRQSVEHFVNQCQQPQYDEPKVLVTDHSANGLSLIKDKLISFIELELFRINAKQLVSGGNDKYTQVKIESYQVVLSHLSKTNDSELTYSWIAKKAFELAQIAKQHCYSSNWLDPQSLNHYRTYFQAEITHMNYEGQPEIDACLPFIKQFLLGEIIRIGMVNEWSSTEIENKVDKLIQHLEALQQEALTEDQLLTILSNLQQTCCQKRHTFGFFTPESATAFNHYVLPIQESIEKKASLSTIEKQA
jgi:hypothetical protein